MLEVDILNVMVGDVLDEVGGLTVGGGVGDCIKCLKIGWNEKKRREKNRKEGGLYVVKGWVLQKVGVVTPL